MHVLPDINDFISRRITKRKISLLQNDMETYHDELTAGIKGKSVLVIGGAGTIGASFIKALIRYNSAKLVVMDINENGLTELVRDCRSHHSLRLPDDFKSYPINFGDPLFEKILQKEGPFHIVANFAAHKHVRSEKDIFSIEAMVRNNVLQAKVLLDQLLPAPPEHFFCVSTDKAANPVNIMGASKKLMEDIILAYSGTLNISTARFANVAFSNGSLLAGFIERIMKKQPLAAPSDVKRYFVSPEEAGQICLLSCVLGQSGDIFFPKLDPEKDLVSFADITLAFIEELGLKAQLCENEEIARTSAATRAATDPYPVCLFASETSGEKLYEEFYTDTELLDMEKFQALGVIKDTSSKSMDEVNAIVDQLKDIFRKNIGKAEIVEKLNQLLPSFQHVEKGKNLDQQM